MSIQKIREGIGNNLRNNIPGLRVSENIPDQPNPPHAVVSLNSVNYDQTFQRGMSEYNFVISVLAGRVAERQSQRTLDSYISAGSATIKAAVEKDKTLGGFAFDVRVSEMSNIGAVSLGEVIYLGADFNVQVYAT
jgi:hypothetical protein